MPKFCGQCGTKVGDEAAFCPECGAKLSQAVASVIPDQTGQQNNVNLSKNEPTYSQQNSGDNANTYNQTGNFLPNNSTAGNNFNDANVQYGLGSQTASKGFNKKTLIILGCAGILVVLLIILAVVSTAGSYKKPLDNIVEVFEDGEGDALKKLMPPSYIEILDSTCEILGEDVDDYFDEAAEEIHDELISEYGKKAKVKYDILYKEELSKADLADAAEDLSVGNGKYSNIKISKGYEVTANFTVSGKLNSNTSKITLQVIKIDGEWVLSMDSLGDLDFD